MTRPRRPEDWDRDLHRARIAERDLFNILCADSRLKDLEDHTDSYDTLDFSFSYVDETVWVDLKEKINPTSRSLASIWPEVAASDLFVVDETVYRRIIWQGGGGYLIVHDHPAGRWAIFGPWELTLGPRVRYAREGQKRTRILKGKILLDLSTAHVGVEFRVKDLLQVVRQARQERDQIGPVAIPGYPVG